MKIILTHEVSSLGEPGDVVDVVDPDVAVGVGGDESFEIRGIEDGHEVS